MRAESITSLRSDPSSMGQEQEGQRLWLSEQGFFSKKKIVRHLPTLDRCQDKDSQERLNE